MKANIRSTQPSVSSKAPATVVAQIVAAYTKENDTPRCKPCIGRCNTAT